MPIELRVSPRITNEALNALFSAGDVGAGWPAWQRGPDTSDWQPVLARSLAYVCALEDETVVGFVNVAWDGRDHAFLLDTRVHPNHRGHGLGRRMVARAAEAARAAGCTVLHVDYAAELAPFYRACGFEPTDAGLLALQR